MSTLGKAVQFPQAPLSISLVSFAASAVAMALRLVLNSIRSVSSRAKSTSQEISSLIRLSSSRRINNNLTNKIFVRRYDDDHEPPPENFESRKKYYLRTPIPFRFRPEAYQRYVIDTALFAVNFHNQKENAQLRFVRALKVDYVPTGGVRLYITLEVRNAGKFEVYRTVVFFRPWTNYRRVLNWERVEELPLSERFD